MYLLEKFLTRGNVSMVKWDFDSVGDGNQGWKMYSISILEFRKLYWNVLIPFRAKIRKPLRQRRKLRRLMLILLWSNQSNQNQKCWKREGTHFNIVKILSTLWYGSTALLSFPSNPLVPLLKVAQISLIPPFRSFDHNFTISVEDWSEHIRLTKINLWKYLKNLQFCPFLLSPKKIGRWYIRIFPFFWSLVLLYVF